MNPTAVVYAVSAICLAVLFVTVLGYRRALSRLSALEKRAESLQREHEAKLRETERRHESLAAEQAARTEGLRLAAQAARGSNVGTCLWDAEGSTLWSNRSWDEAVGRLPADGLKSDTTPDAAARLRDAIFMRTPASEELEIASREGKKLWLRISVTPLPRMDLAGPEPVLGVCTDLSAEHEAGEILAHALERFEEALTGGGLGIWEWTPATDSCSWDERARQLFGRDEAAPAYDVWIACLHPEDVPAFETRLRASLLGREPLDTAVRVRPETAGPRTLALRGKVLRDARGTPLRVVGVVADVTEEAKLREQLRLAGERLRLSLTGANDGVWEWQADEDCFVMDDKWFSLTGTNADAPRVSRATFDRFIHPEDTLVVSGALALGASGSEGKLDLEFRIATPNERWTWLRWRGTVAARDASGRTRTLCGTYTDVTERRRTEESLRSSALLLRQMCQQMGIAAWRLDLSNFGLAWTEELDLLHAPPPDFVPALENLLALYPAEARRELTHAIERSIDKKEPFDLEVRWLSQATSRWYRWTGYPVEERGSVLEVCGLVQDVTTERETAAQRRELDSRLAELRQYETLSAITDDLAYDLNNLLSNLLGFQELSCEELPAGHKARGYILEAMRTSNRIHDIIRQVILLNRVKPTARIGLRPQVLAEEICERLAHTLPETISLSRDLDKFCPPVSGDAAQLQQALLSIATQAASVLLGHEGRLGFSLSTASVSLEEAAHLGLTVAGDFCRIRIAAGRPGLGEEEWQRLFSHSSRDPGFNLASARKTLSEHQGTLRLLCNAEGEGICELWLPLSRTLQKHPASDTPVPLGAGEEVWILNAERFVARLAKMSLENSGYRSRVFRNPADFAEALRTEPSRCRAVILGNSLQGLTPGELVASARNAVPDLPAISVGSLSDLAGLPGCHLLSEPFTSSDLARTVYDALHPLQDSPPILEAPDGS